MSAVGWIVSSVGFSVGITHSLPVDSGVLAQTGGQWGQYEQYRGTLPGLSLRAGNIVRKTNPHPCGQPTLSPTFTWILNLG